MSIALRAKQYGKIFTDWTIRDLLGQGSGGKTAVFRLTRKKLTYEETAAMKVVNIIEEAGSYSNMSEEYKLAYTEMCEELSQKAEHEVMLMYKLRGNGNIVNYLDFEYADWEDENVFGRDLLIRMECLDNLGARMKTRHFTEAEIVKVGKDICNALISCHKIGVLHRDIKPDNIFVTQYDTYLLGDFGISKMLRNSQNASTTTGTSAYAAPEQFKKGYDFRVDIYSLGLSLYQMANDNKLPFSKSAFARAEDIQMRINGKQLPVLNNVSNALSDIILKACAYEPDDRYQSAEEFYDALNMFKASTINVGENEIDTIAVNTYATEAALNLQMQDTKAEAYTTMPAFNIAYGEKEVNSELYETMPAFNSQITKKEVSSDAYETVAALNTDVPGKEEGTNVYETVAALNTEVLGKESRADVYETVAALNTEVLGKESGTDIYETVAALNTDVIGKESGSEICETKPALNMDSIMSEDILEEGIIVKDNIEEILSIDMASVARQYDESGQRDKADLWYGKSENSKVKFKMSKLSFIQKETKEVKERKEASGNLWYRKK